MSFGKEGILAARLRLRQERDRKAANDEQEAKLERQQALARVMVLASHEISGVGHGAILSPIDSEALQDRFRREQALVDDETKLLRLRVNGVPVFCRYNYYLSMKGDEARYWCGAFTAALDAKSLAGGFRRYVEGGGMYIVESEVATGLAYQEEKDGIALPVIHGSDTYRFIGSVGRLFIPGVNEAMEAEGL